MFERSHWEPIEKVGHLTVIVIRDSRSGAVVSNAMLRMGADNQRYVIDMIVGEINWLGYTIFSFNSTAFTLMQNLSLGALQPPSYISPQS